MFFTAVLLGFALNLLSWVITLFPFYKVSERSQQVFVRENRFGQYRQIGSCR